MVGVSVHGSRGRGEHYLPDLEGVEPKRQLGLAVVSFNDGHSEARKSTTINPPANPADGSSQSLINSHFWDPRQRASSK